jgi:multiple antibiotic resistance protein
MENVHVLGRSFTLAFSALLPVLDPLGSALLFLALIGSVPEAIHRNLARNVAISTMFFLVGVELAGTAFLSFFGISLPVLQLSGGLVLAAMGRAQLHQTDYETTRERAELPDASFESLRRKTFYPLTFPVTAGPAAIVVTLTLSAHAAGTGALGNLMAHVGILVAIVALSALVFLTYHYAPRITRHVSPETAHGIRRVISFVLLCIGVQIGWNGLESMLKSALRQ